MVPLGFYRLVLTTRSLSRAGQAESGRSREPEQAPGGRTQGTQSGPGIHTQALHDSLHLCCFLK